MYSYAKVITTLVTIILAALAPIWLPSLLVAAAIMYITGSFGIGSTAGVGTMIGISYVVKS